MKHQVIIYYAFCPNYLESPKSYREYQKKIEEKILNCDFINRFRVRFEWNKVGKGRYGKPYWLGKEKIYFNVSNTSGLVVCACSDCEIGVDAEKAREVRMPILKKCCSPEEISYIFQEEEQKSLIQSRFLQLWTLKESYIKMTGEGMHFPMKEITFSLEEGEPQIKSNRPEFFVQEKVGDYWIALCAREEAEVVWREVNVQE